MLGLEPILRKEKPDKVMVYGDTNTSVSAALTAAKMGIPVAHIEAGPRQYDLAIPEEINRVTIDHISTYLFAPTQHCANVLLMENIPIERIWTSGDVMLDNFMHFAPKCREYKYTLVTIHRPVNTDNEDRLNTIMDAVGKLDNVVFPMHPRTRKSLRNPPSFKILEPLGYLDMMNILMESRLVITDSGGLQKEAFWAGVPCLNLDVRCLWPEIMETGWNRIVPPELIGKSAHDMPIGHISCGDTFGDGRAHKLIAEILVG
jgi:UDP-N-acetylglucosamine 2-epimerase